MSTDSIPHPPPVPPAALEPVGRLLGCLGAFSRSTPYFRGKWRLAGFMFRHWMRHSRQAQTIQLSRGIRVQCKLWDEVQNAIWWNGRNYERKETLFLASHLRPGMVFFDVGANVGYFALVAAPLVGASGQVHAFEPVAQQFADLQSNFRLNDLQNAIANRLIISRRAGAMTINLGPPDNSGSASVGVVYRADRATETVASLSLDDYVRTRGLARVDVMKIDTEGHELEVLRGAARVLREHRPLILVEVRGELLAEAGASRGELFALLTALGYSPFAIHRDGRPEPMLVPADGNLVIFRPRPEFTG